VDNSDSDLWISNGKIVELHIKVIGQIRIRPDQNKEENVKEIGEKTKDKWEIEGNRVK
jgi:hypothetical protein